MAKENFLDLLLAKTGTWKLPMNMKNRSPKLKHPQQNELNKEEFNSIQKITTISR